MANSNYDRKLVFEALRELGLHFLKKFKAEPIPEDEQSTFKLFRQIESEAKSLLTSKLNSKIPFAEGELDLNQNESLSNAGTYWLFDSMDGAVQYMRHLPGWTFNLALLVEGEIIFSVLFDPLHDEMFWAEKGSGAFLGMQQIKVQKRAHSTVMMAATSHPPFPNRVPGLVERIADADKALLRTYSFLRNLGPTALQIAYVAAGRIDVYGQAGCDIFNWLPGILIAQEAGAAVYTLSGQPWNWRSESLLIGEATVVSQLLSQGTSLR